MPSGLFLLSRFFLRVDNVLFRIYDVRLYHDFETGEVIREAKGKEAPYNDVRTVSRVMYLTILSSNAPMLTCNCRSKAPAARTSRRLDTSYRP